MSDYCLVWLQDLKLFFDEPVSTFLYPEFLHRVLSHLNDRYCAELDFGFNFYNYFFSDEDPSELVRLLTVKDGGVHLAVRNNMDLSFLPKRVMDSIEDIR